MVPPPTTANRGNSVVPASKRPIGVRLHFKFSKWSLTPIRGMMAGAVFWVGAAVSCARPIRAPAPQTDVEPSVFLFSYFTRNGDDGLHLAYSEDGIKWLPLNGARSFL